MTVKLFYLSLGESYSEIIERLKNDDRIKRYLKMFINDETYNNFVKAYNDKDYPTAFRMAHTLKGMAANLGLNEFFALSSAVTEKLRYEELSGLNELVIKLSTYYEKLRNSINELD